MRYYIYYRRPVNYSHTAPRNADRTVAVKSFDNIESAKAFAATVTFVDAYTSTGRKIAL